MRAPLRDRCGPDASDVGKRFPVRFSSPQPESRRVAVVIKDNQGQTVRVQFTVTMHDRKRLAGSCVTRGAMRLCRFAKHRRHVLATATAIYLTKGKDIFPSGRHFVAADKAI